MENQLKENTHISVSCFALCQNMFCHETWKSSLEVIISMESPCEEEHHHWALYFPFLVMSSVFSLAMLCVGALKLTGAWS